ncbi:MAG: cyclic nucleotide-binding domain-containing protein [Pseudomonadota bacterium]
MQVVYPMSGCQVVVSGERTLLFGQPPEVIKSLARHNIHRLDTLVLRDSRASGDVLLNNIEFPLYHFLFISNGLQERRKLRLVGYRAEIEQAVEVLRLTLLGPTRDELIRWGTEAELREEWLNAMHFFALKDASGNPLGIRDFFEFHELDDGPVEVDGLTIAHESWDVFSVTADGGTLKVDLNDDSTAVPPYPLHADQTPSVAITFGVDVLGGASGFSTEEASTGMVLNFNGNLMLIDSIPFVDQHLSARGQSKNQVTSMLLTHLHDDHCNLFPLMLSPQRVELLTTREIYEMLLIKLSMGLGWRPEVIAECFQFVELVPGETITYFGLEIEPHVTVHSIPTIGATFSLNHLGRRHSICIVGDNQSFGEIAEMRASGLLRESTEANLRRLYRDDFDLLVADGGMGVIHGDPADALDSRAERVVFVHVDRLPDRFTTTFSLASTGKRYVIVEAEDDLLTTRAVEFFQANFKRPVPRRWLNALLSDKRMIPFNRDDVVLKQGSSSRGNVYLVLFGDCDVIYHDGERRRVVGTREAGDFIGEMAAVTGVYARNASVVARTPVILCEFSEETFHAYVQAEGLVPELRRRWQIRDRMVAVPLLQSLSTAVVERLCDVAEEVEVPGGARFSCDAGHWYLLASGAAAEGGRELGVADEGGELPFGASGWQELDSERGCVLLRFNTDVVRRLSAEIPQLGYRLRAYRQKHGRAEQCDWTLPVLASG